jgi:hypothetical protein
LRSARAGLPHTKDYNWCSFIAEAKGLETDFFQMNALEEHGFDLGD